MVLNPTLDVLCVINSDRLEFQRREPHTTLSLNVFKHCLYARRAFQVALYVTSMLYFPKLSAFVDDNNHQIVTNFTTVLVNT